MNTCWGPAYGVAVPDPLAVARRELALMKDELRASRASLALVRSALAAAEAECERLREIHAASRALPMPCKSARLAKALREASAV